MVKKSRTTAILLALFFGNLGVHRYYLGYKKRGVLLTLGYVSMVLGIVISTAIGITRIARLSYLDTGEIIGLLLSCALMLFGAVTSVLALVDFIKLLCNKLQPADGDFDGGSSYHGKQVGGALVAEQVAQYIIDSRAAVPAFYEYHRLLEEGIISGDDYIAKKKQLLGLDEE